MKRNLKWRVKIYKGKVIILISIDNRTGVGIRWTGMMSHDQWRMAIFLCDEVAMDWITNNKYYTPPEYIESRLQKLIDIEL